MAEAVILTLMTLDSRQDVVPSFIVVESTFSCNCIILSVAHQLY